MTIIKINDYTDIITNDYTEFDQLTPVQQVDYIETENKLFYFERMKRRQARRKTRLF